MHKYTRKPLDAQAAKAIKHKDILVAIFISSYLLFFLFTDPSPINDLTRVRGFFGCGTVYLSTLIFVVLRDLKPYPILSLLYQLRCVALGGLIFYFNYYPEEFIDVANFSLPMPLKLGMGGLLTYMLYRVLLQIGR